MKGKNVGFGLLVAVSSSWEPGVIDDAAALCSVRRGPHLQSAISFQQPHWRSQIVHLFKQSLADPCACGAPLLK